MFPELDLFGLDIRIADDAAIFVILFAKTNAELRSARPYRERPWIDQIRLGEPAGELGDRFL